MKLNKLKIGKVFRNYKDLCSELEMEWNPSNRSKIYKILERYCSFYKEGHKIHIVKVYEKEILKDGFDLYGNVHKKDVFGVIYKIENKINKKVYIGQTTRKNGFDDRYGFNGEGIERVYGYHLAQKEYGAKYNTHLVSSIKKYGFDAFKVIKIFDVSYSKEELDEKEIYWIKYYKSTDKNYGYNQLVGGDGYSEGKSVYLSKLGISRRPIICLETSEVFLTATEASKKTGICDTTIRNVCTGKYRSAYSKLHKKKLTFDYIELTKGKDKPVICITSREKFNSAKDASVSYNVDMYSIIANCEGKAKSASRHPITNEKLVWKYQLDYALDIMFCDDQYIKQAK